ncbi:MAG: esterase, partial [Cytophagaceae bacterium]
MKPYKQTTIRAMLVAALLCVVDILHAQPPRGPLVVSPQVNADKTVTFRYQAPQAKVVELSAQFEKAPVPMTKDAQGIWSATVGAVKPDIYPYNFRVDGVSVMDPAN